MLLRKIIGKSKKFLFSDGITYAQTAVIYNPFDNIVLTPT